MLCEHAEAGFALICGQPVAVTSGTTSLKKKRWGKLTKEDCLVAQRLPALVEGSMRVMQSSSSELTINLLRGRLICQMQPGVEWFNLITPLPWGSRRSHLQFPPSFYLTVYALAFFISDLISGVTLCLCAIFLKLIRDPG